MSVLFCRTNAISTIKDVCPNYPKKYDIEVSEDGSNFVSHSSVIVEKPPTSSKSNDLPVFTGEFNVSDKNSIASARLYISGLGLYDVSINGRNVTDSLFNPGESDVKDTVYYNTYDVTDLLKAGGNAIGIILGNGAYNVGSLQGGYQKHGDSMGDLKVIAQMEITLKDGRIQYIVTDESWKQTYGPYTFSGWYGGEDYDATKEITKWDEAGTDRSSWLNAVKIVAPAGKLKAAVQNPIRIKENIKA